MALKDLVIDADERTALEIIKPIYNELWPKQAQKLYDDIVAALRLVRNEKR